MRPITDDVVLGLLKGLETREKNALANRAAAAANGDTARHSRKVVNLDAVKTVRREKRISKGLFSYITAG